MAIHTLFEYSNDKDKLLEVLRQKPDLNIQDKHGDTLAMIAFDNFKIKDVMLEVLRQKPDLNIQNDYGYTVAMIAFGYGDDKDVLLKLLKQKPDLTVKNYFNKTALDYALQFYVKSPNFEFDVLEKLYDENCKQDKQLINLKYLRLKRKYKVLPLILFRHQKRYGV